MDNAINPFNANNRVARSYGSAESTVKATSDMAKANKKIKPNG